MSTIAKLIERVATWFNELGCWRSECLVWGQRMTSASFDRWLYLRMHRSRRMGVEEQAILQKLIQPGMTVLDVGGNLGLYTILISRLVGGTGRVVSFEPDPDLFALLQTNTALNGCTNVGAHNLALGRKRDRLVLRKMILNSGDNTLASGQGKAENSVFTCRLVADQQAQNRLHAQEAGCSVASLLTEVVQNYLLATEGGVDESPVTSVHTHARGDLPDLFVLEDLDAA
jgi:FkbM family methyltransferase